MLYRFLPVFALQKIEKSKNFCCSIIKKSKLTRYPYYNSPPKNSSKRVGKKNGLGEEIFCP